MRILVISNRYPPDIVGGAEVVAASLCEGLSEKGYDVQVLTARASRGPVIRSAENGVSVNRMWPGSTIFPPETLSRWRSLMWQIPVHLQDLRNRWVAREVAQLCAAWRPDVVHTHNLYGLSPIVWSTAKKQGIPVVHTAHDCYLLSPTGNLRHAWEQDGGLVRAFRAIYRWWYLSQTRHVNVFCVPSQHHLDLHRRFGCRAAAYRVVKNGVRESRLAATEFGRDKDGPLAVLYLGRLESHKGIPVLLEAAEQLAGCRIRIALAGAGSLEPEVRRAADRMPHLDFEGFVSGEKRQRLFEQSDLLVLPSVCLECFGTVVLEALACGIPVVVTDIGGPAELIEDGSNGFMIPPNDAKALADLLRDLSIAPERVRSLRANARQSARDGTIEHMTDAYLEAYGEDGSVRV